MIHGIQQNPEDTQLLSILKQRTKNHDLKKYFVSLLDKFGSLKYTEEALSELESEIREEIHALGGNPLLINILDQLGIDKLTKK